MPDRINLDDYTIVRRQRFKGIRDVVMFTEVDGDDIQLFPDEAMKLRDWLIEQFPLEEEPEAERIPDDMPLYDADEDCEHVFDGRWSGYGCAKCDGWYCA